VKVEHPDDSLRISKAIDSEFANSPFETHTDTEKAFAAGWVKQFGNIQFLIMAIGGVVFFTLLLVTGNTMAIAVRERTGELAVLKAVGYSDRFVLLFVL
jgi:putative ABC transport system permease protein